MGLSSRPYLHSGWIVLSICLRPIWSISGWSGDCRSYGHMWHSAMNGSRKQLLPLKLPMKRCVDWPRSNMWLMKSTWGMRLTRRCVVLRSSMQLMKNRLDLRWPKKCRGLRSIRSQMRTSCKARTSPSLPSSLIVRSCRQRASSAWLSC